MTRLGKALAQLEAENPAVKEAADKLREVTTDPLKRPMCKCGSRHLVCPKERSF